MLGEIDTTGDDWESLDAKDFLMEEAEQEQPRQRQAVVPIERHQLPPVQQPKIESVNRQTNPSARQRQAVVPMEGHQLPLV